MSPVGLRRSMKRLKKRNSLPDRMYSAREAAPILGLASPETVKVWIRKGWLKAIQVGARRVWMIAGRVLLARETTVAAKPTADIRLIAGRDRVAR